MGGLWSSIKKRYYALYSSVRDIVHAFAERAHEGHDIAFVESKTVALGPRLCERKREGDVSCVCV